MTHSFAHIELTSGDIGKAKKFYKDLFGWKLTDMKGMPYTMVDTGEGPTGGMQPQPMPHAPIAWLPYVQVDDVVTMLEKAARGGGHVVLDFMPIDGNGAIGIFEDPSGAMLGVWEAPKKKDAAKAALDAMKEAVAKVAEAAGKAMKQATKAAPPKAAKKAAPKKVAAAAPKKAAKAVKKVVKTAKKAAKAPAKKIAKKAAKKR